MSEAPQAPAPSGDAPGVAPAAAPAAPVEPAAPAVQPDAPVAPAQPAQPSAPATPAEPVLTPEEQAAKAEDEEWDAAEKELFPGLKSANKKKDGKDEPAKPKEGAEAEGANKKAPEDEGADAKPGEGADAPAPGTEEQPAGEGEGEGADTGTSARDARLAAAESREQTQAVAKDVREKMYPDLPTELRDQDGDPIRSIEDVMKLINPATGQKFETEEEAGLWFLQANNQFKENLGQIEKHIEQVAEVNVNLKDQSDVITSEFGELLNHEDFKDKRSELWGEYAKTLKTDPKTGIITEAPVSLERFYRTALEPYVHLARELEAREQGTEAEKKAKAEVDAKAKTDADAKRQQTRVDRSPIYGGGTDKNEDPEDKEWADAEATVFGNQLKK